MFNTLFGDFVSNGWPSFVIEDEKSKVSTAFSDVQRVAKGNCVTISRSDWRAVMPSLCSCQINPLVGRWRLLAGVTEEDESGSDSTAVRLQSPRGLGSIKRFHHRWISLRSKQTHIARRTPRTRRAQKSRSAGSLLARTDWWQSPNQHVPTSAPFGGTTLFTGPRRSTFRFRAARPAVTRTKSCPHSSFLIPVMAMSVCLANVGSQAWLESSSLGSSRIVALRASIGKKYTLDLREF